MARPDWLKQAVAAGREFHALKQDPTRHNLRNLATMGLLLSLIGGVVAGAPLVPWPVVVVAGTFLVGCLYFALFILVVHEASHDMFLLHPDRQKQKRWNRFFGRLFAAPFFTNYDQHWEVGHTTHHVRPCTDEDPQEDDPETGRALLRTVLILGLVPGSVLFMNPSNQYGPNPWLMVRGVVTLVLGSVLVGVLWSASAGLAVFGGLQVLLLLTRLKRTQEHGSGLAQEPDFVLRSRTYLYALAPLTSPLNINYHFEHHANFNVPWYLLPAYHRRLLEVVPAALQPYIFHRRYLDQAAGRFEAIPDALRAEYGLERLPEPQAAK